MNGRELTLGDREMVWRDGVEKGHWGVERWRGETQGDGEMEWREKKHRVESWEWREC